MQLNAAGVTQDDFLKDSSVDGKKIPAVPDFVTKILSLSFFFFLNNFPPAKFLCKIRKKRKKKKIFNSKSLFLDWPVFRVDLSED